MAKSQDLIPQPENNLAPVAKESVLRLRGRWAVISSAALAALTQASLLFSWGKRILEWLDLADFTSTRFIEMLRWLFSPSGAQALFVLFITLFFIAVYRTLFPKGKTEQPANNLVEGEQYLPEADVEELQGQYKRLHEKADEQREDISEYVKLKEAYFCYQYLNAPERLRSVFALDILNKSVFNITIEDAVEGYIKFEGTPLKEKPRIINLPINAAPSNEASITIEQALTRAEADFIESQNLLFAEFDLENLVITITGSEPSEKVKSQPLEITRRQGVIRVNKIRKDVDKLRAALKTEQHAHNTHIEELSAQIKELEEEKASLEERNETLNTHRQSEKDELEKQVEGLNQQVSKLQANEVTLQMCISSRDDELGKYEWLREIAEAQALDISRYVTLELVRVFDPHSTTPSIRFDFYIRNKSNYHITIDDKVEGAILFEGKPLTYPLTVIGNELKEFPPLGVGVLAIEQPLRPEEVGRLSEFGDNSPYYFLLNQLRIFVKGGEKFPQVQTQRLIISDLPPEPPAPNVRELKERIKKLERGAAALEKVKSELEIVGKQHGWLHEIADAQAKNISEYVRVERVLLCPLRLTDPIQIPYVEFWLEVYNMSVYDITIHKNSIEGDITFQLNKLLEGKEIIYLEESIPPSSRVNVNIRQRLKPTEVSLLTPYNNDERKKELETLFNLNNLGITISGGTRFPQVAQKRLKLPPYIGVSDQAQAAEVRELKTQVDALQNNLESLSAEWPNLIFMYPQINYVHIDSEKVIREGGDGDNTLVAIIAKFKNEAAPPRKVSPAKSVIAHISYYDVNGRPYEYASDKGAWVNEEYNHVELDVGDTRRLVLAVERPIGNMILGYQNNNDSPDRRRGLSVFRLDKEQFIVQVELVVRGQSEAGRKFKFKLTLKPLFSLELIDPQPPE